MNLVTNQLYREETLDTSSDENAVSAALEKAQDLIEEYLRRPLVSEERTESVHIYPDGSLFPQATPITVAAGYTLEGGGYWLSGGTGTYDFLRGSNAPRDVTYTGGYTVATLPATIRQGIIWTAHKLLRPPSDSELASIPAGTQAASLGDASLSFGSKGFSGANAGLSDDVKDSLKRWVRREP